MSEKIVDDDDATLMHCGHCRGLVRHTKARRTVLHSIYRCDGCSRGCGKCDHCDFVTPTFKASPRVLTQCRTRLAKHKKECASNRAAKALMNEDVTVAENALESCFETRDESGENSDAMMKEAVDFEPIVDSSEAVGETNVSVTAGPSLTPDAMLLPSYGVVSTDRYMNMEVNMLRDHGEAMGGFRSVCWRSRHRTDCYGLDDMVNMEDAKFMFYVTSLFRSNSGAENRLMYRLLKGIEKRHQIDFVQPEVTIPMTDRDADRVCLRGEFAIVDLMPKPKLHYIAGHPCYRIDDVISIHMALQRSVEFTETPSPEPELGRDDKRIFDNLHGCPAME